MLSKQLYYDWKVRQLGIVMYKSRFFYKSCKEFVCLNERKYRTVIRHIVTEGMLKRTCSKWYRAALRPSLYFRNFPSATPV